VLGRIAFSVWFGYGRLSEAAELASPPGNSGNLVFPSGRRIEMRWGGL
jgi:hypothetical protein